MTNWNATDIVLFTDGSLVDGRAGAGWFARSETMMAFGGRLVDKDVRDSTEAEIEALWLGLDAVLERFVGVRTVLAVTDNNGVASLMGGRARNPRYRAMGDVVRNLTRDIRLEFAWTKGHNGKGSGADYANALVDRLASMGRRGERAGGEARFDVHWRRRIAAVDERLARLGPTVTLPEAAELIGVPLGRVNDMLRKGELKLSRDRKTVVTRTAFKAMQATLATAGRPPGP